MSSAGSIAYPTNTAKRAPSATMKHLLSVTDRQALTVTARQAARIREGLRLRAAAVKRAWAQTERGRDCAEVDRFRRHLRRGLRCEWDNGRYGTQYSCDYGFYHQCLNGIEAMVRAGQAREAAA